MSSLATRLTAAQKRHLIEMHVEPGEPPMYWHATFDSPQHRTIRVLARLGLLASDGHGYSQGWYLTVEGERVAAELAKAAREG